MRYLSIGILLSAAAATASDRHATTGLPPSFSANDDLPSDKGANFVLTSGEDATGIVPRVLLVEHRDNDSTSAVVGITGSAKGPFGETNWVGSGFFVDACHVATAGHVATFNGWPAESLTVGWGARPKSTIGSANFNLEKNFSRITPATVEWLGTSAGEDKDFAKLNNDLEFQRRQRSEYGYASTVSGKELAGDWAILKVKNCRAKSAPVLNLPETFNAFIMRNYGAGQILKYWSGLGYPGGEFEKIAITRCALSNKMAEGTRVACKVRGGNSGGPLLYSNESSEVAGILSNGDDTHASFIPSEAAGFALLQPPPAAPLPGCVQKIKAYLLPAIRRIDSNAQPDGAITREFKAVYYRAAYSIARATAASGASFIPPVPDPFWCQIFETVASKNQSAGIDQRIPAGEWHYARLGLTVSKNKGLVMASLSGHFFAMPGRFSDYNIVAQSFGRRLIFQAQTKEPVGTFFGKTEYSKYQWTIDFFDGQPPLFTSFKKDVAGPRRGARENHVREVAVFERFKKNLPGAN